MEAFTEKMELVLEESLGKTEETERRVCHGSLG
jgi:hypothetical protein